MKKRTWLGTAGITVLMLTAGCRLLEHPAGTGMKQDPTDGNVLGMEFVRVKPGSFEMGSYEGRPDEQPVRTVQVTKNFWIGRYPVTQRQYRQLTGRNPSRFKGDDRPVEWVLGRDARSFCERLTERERSAGRLPEGLVYRLPTEAEWEYAARGGHLATDTLYAGSDDIDAVAWHKGNSGGTTHPVGMKAPNELGLHDMSGNILEWCYDWYQGHYKGLPDTDPVGPHSGSYRVIRGGSFSCDAFNCRAASRDSHTQGLTPFSFGFRVVLGPPVDLGECGSMEFKRAFQHSTPTLTKTLPYTLPWDDMPIDLSFVYEDEKPAGKRGFLTVQGDKFVFEDGTEARFWGTNFNGAQLFPSHEHSEKLARRLAKIGVNLVRLHQLDGEWSTPNIFQFSRGAYKPDTQSFDPESLDRLDYLIHCLKEEGIYVYMDLLVHRRFKTGDGVAAATRLGRIAAKPYATFNRRMIELQKKYNYDLWTHVNPYTGLAYKDEPAIVLAGIVNENDVWSRSITVEPYRTELEGMYRKWAAENGKTLPEGKIEFALIDRTMNEFYIYITRNYYTEILEHLRETGVRIPVTGTNWSRGSGHIYSQLVTDFTDAHDYWRRGGGPTGSGRRNLAGFFGNLPMTTSLDNMLPVPSFNRVQGRPFFLSEWDHSWPNEWRAESTLLLAAAGALQDWNGFAIHTYRYTKDENVDMIGKPITSGALGGTVYRGGVFDTFNDPAKFGLFYHAALIFRRGDVRPAEKTVSAVIDDLYLPLFRRGSAGLADRSQEINIQDMANAKGLEVLQLTAEQHRVEMVLPGMTPEGQIPAKLNQQIVDVDKGEVLSDTGELYRNLNKAVGWIDSPRTKAVYGFVGKEDAFDLSGVKIGAKTDFATVAISSLTDDPIRRSPNLLLTAVGRADNTNAVYNEDRTRQLDPGHGPILVEIIEADIEIETDKKNLIVMGINTEGMVIGYIPTRYENGVLKFRIGSRHQSMYYLIQEL